MCGRRIPNNRVGNLSGGNQQKVLLAKWLQTKPKLILLHEPTQGVDVGARQQIYQILKKQTATGTMILCASSDYEELATPLHPSTDIQSRQHRGRINRNATDKKRDRSTLSGRISRKIHLKNTEPLQPMTGNNHSLRQAQRAG